MEFKWQNLFQKPYKPPPREMPLDHFLDKNIAHEYVKNGYVIVKNVISQEIISEILLAYHQIQKHPDFYESAGFISSPVYGKKLQQEVTLQLNACVPNIIDKVFDLNQCRYNFFNILVLKFPNPVNNLVPHQDIPIVDEQTGTGSFLWIPTTDMFEESGALQVLPGSHLWSAWQRTHNIQISPLHQNRHILDSYMKPLYISKGDMIIFDSALVHGSAPNMGNQPRIAMNTAVADKKSPMIIFNHQRKNTMDRFEVDEEFWKEGAYMDPENIPNRYKLFSREKLNYHRSLSPKEIADYIQRF